MIRIEQLCKTFHAGEATEVKAVTGIDLSMESGQFAIIVGPNGCGKSTLLQLISGSVKPDKGAIYFDHQRVDTLAEHKRSSFIARLFQNPLTGTAPELSIVENFRLAALRSKNKRLIIGIDKGFRQHVAESIHRLGMGLENKLDQIMGSLSGGQRQALTLLMGTFDDCRLLLMDEPTSALDPRSSELVMNLANSIIREKKLTAVLVTHRIKDCTTYGDRILHMEEGRIVKDISGDQKKQLRTEEIYSWFD